MHLSQHVLLIKTESSDNTKSNTSGGSSNQSAAAGPNKLDMGDISKNLESSIRSAMSNVAKELENKLNPIVKKLLTVQSIDYDKSSIDVATPISNAVQKEVAKILKNMPKGGSENTDAALFKIIENLPNAIADKVVGAIKSTTNLKGTSVKESIRTEITNSVTAPNIISELKSVVDMSSLLKEVRSLKDSFKVSTTGISVAADKLEKASENLNKFISKADSLVKQDVGVSTVSGKEDTVVIDPKLNSTLGEMVKLLGQIKVALDEVIKTQPSQDKSSIKETTAKQQPEKATVVKETTIVKEKTIVKQQPLEKPTTSIADAYRGKKVKFEGKSQKKRKKEIELDVDDDYIPTRPSKKAERKLRKRQRDTKNEPVYDPSHDDIFDKAEEQRNRDAERQIAIEENKRKREEKKRKAAERKRKQDERSAADAGVVGKRSGAPEPDTLASAIHGNKLNSRDLRDLRYDRSSYTTPKTLIKPSTSGMFQDKIDIGSATTGAEKIEQISKLNINALSKSLFDLQKHIVETLEKGLANTSWKVVAPDETLATDKTKAFKTVEGDRQWTVEIADVDRIRKELKHLRGGNTQGVPTDTADLIKVLREEKVSSLVKKTQGTPDILASQIGTWLLKTPERQIESEQSLTKLDKRRLLNIKQSSIGKGTAPGVELITAIKDSLSPESLINVFKETQAKSIVERDLFGNTSSKNALIKRIAIPAAKIDDRTKTASIGTIHGSERAIPRYITHETGFEQLYNKLISSGDKIKFNAAATIGTSIEKLGVRPKDTKETNDVSKQLLKAVYGTKPLTEKDSETLLPQLLTASKIKDFESRKVSINTNYEKQIGQAIDAFKKSAPETKTIDTVISRMEELGVTAYDVVKSLDRLEELDLYKMLSKVITGSGKNTPLKTLSEQPDFDRSIRDFESAINEMQGALPLADLDRPRRGFHQESLVKLSTRTSPLYKPENDKKSISPEESKTLIKDLNLRIDDILDAASNIKEISVPAGISKLSSLGLTEENAASIKEYRTGAKNFNDSTKFLKNMESTVVDFYSQDLTAMAPFQQFQRAGRNISNVTNAMGNVIDDQYARSKGIPIPETPTLRSVTEKDVIESGKYGTKGYGYNVTAELRSTASTFEDQIEISGKLAKALTSVVKTLVEPSAGGRVASSPGGPATSHPIKQPPTFLIPAMSISCVCSTSMEFLAGSLAAMSCGCCGTSNCQW